MKTTDLIYENQKVLNAMQNLVLQSKKHIEFLAANAPEIRTNLESVAESMQTLADMLENQIVFNRDTRNKFAKIKRMALSQLKNLSGVSKPFVNVTRQTCTSI
jgi:hypothetical protein